MPQKPVFSRPPVVSAPYTFLSNGMIRCDDKRIVKLYLKASAYIDDPLLWEGLFRIASLIFSDPAGERVTAMIYRTIEERNEQGAFPGSVTKQISIARAAFALFEYNTDKRILIRLSEWLRYFEIEFDRLSSEDGLLFRAADLMELLVKLYLTTGLKPILRLCARLRAASFDWTTALHTFKQSIPILSDEKTLITVLGTEKPDTLSYDFRNMLINHAEYLSDGLRFSTYSALFSGNGRDLSAGKTVWQYLRKHHHAICGGTTSTPFLSGTGPDKAVRTMAVASWTEAFASQMFLPDSHWATDELIRITYNALDYCLNHDEPFTEQRVNQDGKKSIPPDDPAAHYARLCRAVACAWQHAITITETGFRINYLLPIKALLSINNQPVLLRMTDSAVSFRCEHSFTADIDLFVSATETAGMTLLYNGASVNLTGSCTTEHEGYYIHTKEEWTQQDRFCFEQLDSVLCMQTYHQGVCFFIRNRLMSAPLTEKTRSCAVSGPAENDHRKTYATLCPVEKRKEHDGSYGDIPVLPAISGTSFQVVLKPYSIIDARLTMLPRGKQRE